MTESLYEKYRPRTFDQVVGQGAVVASLANILKKGTNRTFLLVGPSGCGKTTLARIAATELGFQKNEHDAASNTGIDNMRAIMEKLLYKPLDGTKGKAVVIDECHRLSGNAWDSMLKSLEEPPVWLRWFLCTTDISKVPPAVLTRATKLMVQLVDEDKLFGLLDRVAAKEDLLAWDTQGDVLALCARAAGGSPRAALVNLGACAAATTLVEARELLLAADDSQIPAAVDLARALIGGKPWQVVQPILKGLEKENAESVRHVVRGYTTKVVMGSTGKNIGRSLAVLEAFSKPFHSGDQISPLVLAVGTLLFAS